MPAYGVDDPAACEPQHEEREERDDQHEQELAIGGIEDVAPGAAIEQRGPAATDPSRAARLAHARAQRPGAPDPAQQGLAPTRIVK